MKFRVWLLRVFVDHERMVSGITAWGVRWTGLPMLWFCSPSFHDHTLDQFRRSLIFSSCVLSLCLFMVNNACWRCKNNTPAMGVSEWGGQDTWGRTWSSVCCRLEWECTLCTLNGHCFKDKAYGCAMRGWLLKHSTQEEKDSEESKWLILVKSPCTSYV